MATNFPTIFFTADIAALLKIAEWRVLKFAQGTEYQITPSHSNASGSGTRRVYDIEDVCQIALAMRLLDAGLGSKAIGQILRMLRRKARISEQLELDGAKLRGLFLLILRLQKSQRHPFGNAKRDALFVEGFIEAQVEVAERPKEDFMLLNVGEVFSMMKFRLKKMQKGKDS